MLRRIIKKKREKWESLEKQRYERRINGSNLKDVAQVNVPMCVRQIISEKKEPTKQVKVPLSIGLKGRDGIPSGFYYFNWGYRVDMRLV